MVAGNQGDFLSGDFERVDNFFAQGVSQVFVVVAFFPHDKGVEYIASPFNGVVFRGGEAVERPSESVE